MWSVIDVDGMVGGEECFRSQPNGGSARARALCGISLTAVVHGLLTMDNG